MAEWIDVKKQLPESYRKYLTIGSRGAMRVAEAYVPARELPSWRGDPMECWWRCESKFITATHWMPLPEPPKGGDA